MGERARERDRKGEREGERCSLACRAQLYGGVENKQITGHCHKDSGLVMSTCQEGFPKLPVVHWEGCPIAYLPLQQRERQCSLSMMVRLQQDRSRYHPIRILYVPLSILSSNTAAKHITVFDVIYSIVCIHKTFVFLVHPHKQPRTPVKMAPGLGRSHMYIRTPRQHCLNPPTHLVHLIPLAYKTFEKSVVQYLALLALALCAYARLHADCR